MDIVFAVTFGLLCAAALLVLVRLMRGSTTLDRIVSVDVLITLIVAGTCVSMAAQNDGSNIALLAAFALLGFIGSVAAARLVEKKEPYQ